MNFPILQNACCQFAIRNLWILQDLIWFKHMFMSRLVKQKICSMPSVTEWIHVKCDKVQTKLSLHHLAAFIFTVASSALQSHMSNLKKVSRIITHSLPGELHSLPNAVNYDFTCLYIHRVFFCSIRRGNYEMLKTL